MIRAITRCLRYITQYGLPESVLLSNRTNHRMNRACWYSWNMATSKAMHTSVGSLCHWAHQGSVCFFWSSPNVGITARKLNILKYSLKNMQFKNMKVYFVVNQFKAAVGLEDFPFFDLFVVFIQSENYWPSRYLSVLFRCQKCYICIWNVYVYIITPSASDFKLQYQETVYV